MLKPKSNGLVLGKFMPLHLGHKHLLDTAQANCDNLTIIVCSLSSEPIPGQLRYRWVRELYPTANVVHLKDDNIPQDPSEHIDFWNIWRKALKSFHPEPIDFVFTSETYGDRLALELEAKHHCVDLPRLTQPISGTQVRNDPITYWDYLTAQAKPYFAKSVLITGPESCGKSTLTKMLAAHYNTIGVQEYAREYLETISYDFDVNDLNIIAARHYDECFKARQVCNKIFFSDTSAIETHIYAEHYLGHSSEIIKGFLSVKWDAILLLTPEVPWVSDNQRNLPNYRWEIYNKFKDTIKSIGLGYDIIVGDSYADRFNQAVQLCNKKVF